MFQILNIKGAFYHYFETQDTSTLGGKRTYTSTYYVICYKGKIVIKISLRRGDWVHKTGLTPPLFIEVPVPSQANEWPRLCVLGLSFCLCFYDL
jgi:hypothetical protein